MDQELQLILQNIENKPEEIINKLNSEISWRERELEGLKKEMEALKTTIMNSNDQEIIEILDEIYKEDADLNMISEKINKLKESYRTQIEQLLNEDKELINLLSR